MERILRLIQTLAGTGKTIDELAEEMAVTTRTIRRDLQVLEGAGFPLYDDATDRGKVWRFTDTFRQLPPVTFSLDQVFALFVAHRTLAACAKGPFLASYESVLSKIRATMPKVSVQVARMERSFVATPRVVRDFGGVEGYIELITTAIAKRVVLRGRYYSASRGEAAEREILPYHLWHAHDNLYLIGFCRLRGEVRTFHLERFERLAATNQSFPEPTGFDVEAYIRDAFGAFAGKPENVVLEFNSDSTAYFDRREFHPSQKVSLVKGKVRLSLRVPVSDELVHWVVGFGSWVRVIKPKALAEEVRDEHLRAART
jgi:proteasome accessory factor B